MPTYDYRCPEGHAFEHFYSTISAAQSELPCPTCGKVAIRQISGGAGLVFKGSGFYLTDYGRNAHRTSGDSSAKPEGGARSEGVSPPTGHPHAKGGSGGSDSSSSGGSGSSTGSAGSSSGSSPSGGSSSSGGSSASSGGGSGSSSGGDKG